MSNHWDDSYMGKLRKKIGNDRIITNSVRAIICNDKNKALFIKRRGDGNWGMPAGAMELNVSVYGCLKREVKEETGLDVLEATLIAIYSDPRKQSYTDRYGNKHQVIEYLFRVDKWTGSIEKETDESLDAKFFPIDHLPEVSNEIFTNHHAAVFGDFKKYNGQLFLK